MEVPCTLPAGVLLDSSLPKQLARPEDAELYIGRTVCRLDTAAEGAALWCIGQVTGVSYDLNIPYLGVTYPDGQFEELWWEDFIQCAVADTADVSSCGNGQEPSNPGSHTPPAPDLLVPKEPEPPDAPGRDGPLPPPHAQAGPGPSTAGPAVAAAAAGGAGSSQQAAAEATASGRAAGAASAPAAVPPRKRAAAASQQATQADGPSGLDAEPAAHPESGAGTDFAFVREDEQERPAVRRRLNLEAEDAATQPQTQPEPQPPRHAPATTVPSSSAAAAAVGPRPGPQRPARAPPRRRLGGDEPGPAGHLHRIQLVRFMNHENIEMHFGKHVTFVTGQNGSGKSAILQGLQACLGASARDTGRGSNLAGWVNSRHTTATITLEMWNSTEEECEGQSLPPYRHEVYGSLIRIVRKITLGRPTPDGRPTASGSYSLYRADGSEVRREELGQSAAREVEALVDHFNVDASNPLMVITQDMARQFYQNTRSGPRCSKYEMYMRGTSLAAVRDWLAAAQPKLELMRGHLARAGEQLQGRRDELAALEARVRELRRADELKGQLADAELAAVWAAVAESEEVLRVARQGAAGGPGTLAALEVRVEAEQRAEAELAREEEALREQMNATRAEELPARLRELKARKQAAHRRREQLRATLAASQRDAEELEGTRRARLVELERVQAEQRSEAAVRRLREQQARIDAKRAQLAELQAAATALEGQRSDLQARATAAEAQRANAQAARNAAHAALTHVRDAHAQLSAAAAAAAAGGGAGAAAALLEARWGRPMMQLVREVARARPGTFSSPPIGPLGMYLRRSADCDPRFAAPLEVALRGVLHAWLFETREDVDVFKQMAARLRCTRPQTTVAPPTARVHEYGREPVVDERRQRWWRVIDLVTVDEALDPRVRATITNTLVDNAAASSTVLVEARDTAQAVARGRLPALQARRIGTAYDVGGAQYADLGGTMVTTPHALPSARELLLAPDERAQAEEAARQMAERVQEAAQEVAGRQAELAEAEAALRAAAQAATAAAAERRDLQARQVELAVQLRRCQSELTSLEDALVVAESGGASQDLLNSLRETAERLREIAASSSQLEEQMNNAAAEEQEARTEMDSLQEQSSQYVRRREELLGRLEQLGARKGEVAARLRARREELERAREEVNAVAERIRQFEARVEEARAHAGEVCTREEGEAALQRARAAREAELRERYPNRSEQDRAARLQEAMTSKGLDRWIHSTRAAIERAEAQAGGDLESVLMRAEAVRREVVRAEEAVKSVAKKHAGMSDAHTLRVVKYKGLRNKTQELAGSKFNKYMQRRNITGFLKLNHDDKRLSLKIRKNNEREQVASLMQMSGGERSFMTASFLLAMGEVVNTPFRAMDEYDVFMDANARKMVTMALLEYAWRSRPGSQLILLSPQDTATLLESEAELRAKCEREKVPLPPPGFMKVNLLRDPRAGGRQ